jgi:hypothetical protein
VKGAVTNAGGNKQNPGRSILENRRVAKNGDFFKSAVVVRFRNLRLPPEIIAPDIPDGKRGTQVDRAATFIDR